MLKILFMACGSGRSPTLMMVILVIRITVVIMMRMMVVIVVIEMMGGSHDVDNFDDGDKNDAVQI